MKNRIVSLMLLCVAVTACFKKAPLPTLPEMHVEDTPPSEVESVVYVVGDMGDALWDRSPMPRKLRNEVDWWSRALNRDTSVVVLFLGDNVYPAGMHDRNDPLWAADSTHLETQAKILQGQKGTNRAIGIFIAGNHDWGHKPPPVGEERLRNQEEFLTRRRLAGTNVRLLPPGATPGPGIVDVGTHFRILLIDTAWWLLSADVLEKERMMQRLQTQLSVPHERSVMIAAHHPMRSASAHGGLTSFWKAFGVRWLLSKSGAALQDLNSLPYRDLLDRLNAIFRVTGPPLLFAGGHDHSLQVIKATEDQEPRYMIVSGAGSKSSTMGDIPGMLYRSVEPGFMQLIIKKNGGIDLRVYTAPSGYLMCDVGAPAVMQQCVESGSTAFEPKFGIKLK